MTDGATQNVGKTIQMVKDAKAKAGPYLRINTIGFGLKKGEGYDALEQIARATGGTFKPIDMNEINQMYEALPDHLKNPKNKNQNLQKKKKKK